MEAQGIDAVASSEQTREEEPNSAIMRVDQLSTHLDKGSLDKVAGQKGMTLSSQGSPEGIDKFGPT